MDFKLNYIILKVYLNERFPCAAMIKKSKTEARVLE